jgi:hypothetical protein
MSFRDLTVEPKFGYRGIGSWAVALRPRIQFKLCGIAAFRAGYN